MLSEGESSMVLELLRDEQRTLEELMADFDSKFCSSILRFKVCFSLSDLLKEKPSKLTPYERLVAFCLIYQTYSSQEPVNNPFFFTLFLEVVCDEDAEKFERGLILQLLGASRNEVLKQSAADYVKGFNPSSLVFPSRDQLQEEYVLKATPQYNSVLWELWDSFVKNVISDPDVPPQCDASSPEFDLQRGSTPKIGSGYRDEAIEGLLQNLSPEGIGRQWIRPFPLRFPVQDDELVWLNVDSSHELLWDYSMGDEASIRAMVRDLIAKAVKGPLTSSQHENLLLELKHDPKLVDHCGLTLEMLPDLIHHNYLIAPEVLKLNLSMGCFSLKAVYNLIEEMQLPPEFLNSFKKDCLRAMVRDLIAKAVKGPLSSSQHENLLLELKHDPKLVDHCGLTLEMLPDLVHNNYLIALEVLPKMNLPMSPFSLKAVYNLSEKVELPPEFLDSFKKECNSSDSDSDSYKKFKKFLEGNRPVIKGEDCTILIKACKKFLSSKKARLLINVLNRDLLKASANFTRK